MREVLAGAEILAVTAAAYLLGIIPSDVLPVGIIAGIKGVTAGLVR